ncbi:hypothetical protein [Bradyrhizobium sp. 5.13L]
MPTNALNLEKMAGTAREERAFAHPTLFGQCMPVYPPRHCERSEAIQNPSAERLWIASLRSQ